MKERTIKVLRKAYSALIWIVVILFVVILLIVNVKSDRSKKSSTENIVTSVAESQILEGSGF